MNKNTISIASDNYIAFKKSPSSRDSEYVVVNLSTKDVKRVPAVGSAFALSPDGFYLASVDRNRLELVRVNTGEIKRSTTLDDDTTVSRMKWLNDGTIWLATTYGIMLWKYDSSEEPDFLVEYDESMEYTQVVDFHLSPDGEWYLIHYTDDAIGKMQLGQVGGNYWSLMEGMAGSFVSANNCFYKDPLVCYFYREEENKDKYFFKTDNLANPQEKYMDPGEMDWDDDLEGNYAEYLISNEKSCLAIMTTHEGEIQLWDIRHGLILCQSQIYFTAEVLVPLSTEGFVGVQRESTIVSRVTFDPETAIMIAYKRRFNSQLPFHVACRYGMHDLTNETMISLCNALYSADIPTLLTCLITLGTAKSPDVISKKFLVNHASLVGKVMEFIFNTWCFKEGIDWEAEISWFFSSFKDKEVDTAPSPLSCRHLKTIEEEAKKEDLEVWELKARFLAQSLGINHKGFSIVVLLYKLIRENDIDLDNSVVTLSLAMIDEDDREDVRELLRRLKQWEKGNEECNSLEKLAHYLIEKGWNEMSEEAHERLVVMFPDPVIRGIEKVNLRHMLAKLGKENSSSIGDFIKDHVKVESLDVTELALKLLDLEEKMRDDVLKETIDSQFHDIYTKAKAKVFLRRELERLTRWKPYIGVAEKMMKDNVTYNSDLFDELLDGLYDQSAERESARSVLVEILKANSSYIC